MFPRFCVRFSLIVLGIAVLFSPRAVAAPVRLIYDTDMQTDCDDVGALAALHALADLGEVEILGAMVCVLNPASAPCTDAINTFYGRPHLPLGVLKGTSGVNLSSAYAAGIAQNFPHDTVTSALPDAVVLYRKLLANEADGSVVILSVGYMTILQKLLHSPADDISPLTGAQLIQQKVKKWICMGGNFPNDATNGSNVNFRRDPAAVIDCVTNWPGPIEFVGREIGHNMRAGARLATLPASNPVRRAYELFFGGTVRDQHCADIAAVLYGVRGLSNYWQLENTGSVQFTEAGDARFNWVNLPDKNEAYIVADMSPVTIQELLEDLMIQPPGSGQARPTVSFTAPAPNSRVEPGQAVTLTANAADANGSVAKVEFFANFVKVGESTAAPYSVQWSSDQIGTHQITAKATDNQWGTTISEPLNVQVGNAPANGSGLTGNYFDNVDFTSLKHTRIDPAVNFDWGTGSPHASVAADSFSVRWTGAVLPVHASGAQSYTFCTSTNDGVRLWVNDQLIIDDWTNGPLREKSGSIVLAAKRLHTIRMEFFENTNSAAASLSWEAAGLPKQLIPQSQLFPQANQAPAVVPDSASADQDLPVTIAVLANDLDPDLAPQPLAIASATGGAPGSTLGIAGGSVIYTPAPGFLGNDSFTYTATDGQSFTVGSVSVAVQPWATFEPFQRKYFGEDDRDDPEIAGWLADPDGDGWVNALEYAQFTHPLEAEFPAPAEAELRAGHLVLTFRKRKNAVDHACLPEVSGTLVAWNSGAEYVDETVLSDDGVQQIVEARDRAVAGPESSRFMRLRVIQQP